MPGSMPSLGGQHERGRTVFLTLHHGARAGSVLLCFLFAFHHGRGHARFSHRSNRSAHDVCSPSWLHQKRARTRIKRSQRDRLAHINRLHARARESALDIMSTCSRSVIAGRGRPAGRLMIRSRQGPPGMRLGRVSTVEPALWPVWLPSRGRRGGAYLCHRVAFATVFMLRNSYGTTRGPEHLHAS